MTRKILILVYIATVLVLSGMVKAADFRVGEGKNVAQSSPADR